MKYRAEIDGLRAVAVIPVILFHAGFEYFSGGFVGVDIFFVISGYLITTIILSEKEQGTFSLVNFYERRARRILPPLFLVMLVSLPFAWLWLMPVDMQDFSQSLIAVSTFTSNILFWQEEGYWGTANELKPLLHTWSLSVEEQFYLFFPLFLMLMWRFRKRWIFSSLIAIAAGSLVVAQWGAHNNPTASFFLLLTRGWELAIGAGIAFYFVYRKPTPHPILSHKAVAEVLGMLGLLMIGYAISTFDETVPFPSFYALAPTLGAGLIILFASPGTFVGRLLGARLPVGIGLVSYSAYLWHQPLFAFARHTSLTEPSEQTFAALAILSFPLAYLSWRYVERPFRQKDKVSRKTIFTFAATGSLAFILIGVAGHMTGGFLQRSIQSAATPQSLEAKLRVNYGLSPACKEVLPVSSDCRTSDKPEILIWGDSFARHLTQGIMASNPDAKIIQMTKSGCGPLFDLAPFSEHERTISSAKRCLAFTGQVREWLKTNDTVEYVVVSSPFSQYLLEDRVLLLRSGELVEADMELAVREFKKTLDELQAMGVTPIVFSPPPSNGIDLGRCLARAEWFGKDLGQCNFHIDEMSQHRLEVYRFLEAIKKHHRVIRLDDLMCNSDLCKAHLGETFLYRDSGHLSLEGSAALGKRYDFHRMITNDE
jgi:peptidoglycan/LPS O-acetylase OafA/YrhL